MDLEHLSKVELLTEARRHLEKVADHLDQALLHADSAQKQLEAAGYRGLALEIANQTPGWNSSGNRALAHTVKVLANGTPL